jgi:hypothetical protein
VPEPKKKKKGKNQVASVYILAQIRPWIKTSNRSVSSLHRGVIRLRRTTQRKYFDYFTFNTVDYSVNCGLIRSGARHRALTQTIGNARGLDINSPRSVENYHQDLRFRRHQQHDDPNSVRGLDNNFASDRDCDSTTIT